VSAAGPLLCVEHLKVDFRTEEGVVHAVDDVSFDLRPGEILAVVGESGSGKSVTAMTLMGLTRSPNSEFGGRALLGEVDLVSAPEDQLRRIRGKEIAMIFQDPMTSLNPVHRIGAQIVEQIQAHEDVADAEARDRVVGLLERVGIPRARERVDSWPHEFSGGMRQRVMIAMALCNDPKLLIADEPTTALDVTVQAQILDLMHRLQEELDTAIVMITHDLGVVAEVTDDIAVMYAGRIVEKADKDTIFAAPEHPYTWGLLKSIPRLDTPRDEELVPIPGRPPSLITLPSGCSFHPRCPYVREAHTRVDPRIEPAPDNPRHGVACLLDHGTRRKLWASLRAGEQPAAARRHVVDEEPVA